MAADILVVDDEADIRELISGILQDDGYETRLAHNSDSALGAIADRRPSLVILDIWLQGSRLDGLELLGAIKETNAELPVIIISGHGNIETAVSAIKSGAYDYIEKPFSADRLGLVVTRALESRMACLNEPVPLLFVLFTTKVPGVIRLTAVAQGPNSDVLPPASVALAVTKRPGVAVGIVTLKVALPDPSAVMLVEPRKLWPSPLPVGSQASLKKNCTV